MCTRPQHLLDALLSHVRLVSFVKFLSNGWVVMSVMMIWFCRNKILITLNLQQLSYNAETNLHTSNILASNSAELCCKCMKNDLCFSK